jgi:hypothetical protein
MIETLTGRLKWERIGGGIRVVIPARMSWGAVRRLLIDLSVYIGAFLCLFLIVGCVAFFRGLNFHTFLNSHGMHSLYLTSLGCCTGLIIARTVPRLFGATIVTISPDQITVEWNSRLRRDKGVFPTATLRGFRFVERSDEVPLKNRLGQNEVQFVQAQSICHFGEGITREEAEALICKMVEVYSFPS